MKKQRSFLFLIFILFALKPYANILGSDMYWTFISKDSILVQVDVFGDCRDSQITFINAKLACADSVGKSFNFSLSNPMVSDATNYCATTCSKCDVNCNSPFGIRKYSFYKVLDISGLSCCLIRFSISGQRSSRLTNGGASEPFYSYFEVNKCKRPFVNCPFFNEEPAKLICKSYDFFLNPEITFLGSDSLLFKLSPPLNDSINYITYTNSFDSLNPFSYWGFPNHSLDLPKGFHLDENGKMLFRPTDKEEGVLSIEITQKRNGQIVAKSRREAWFKIIDCLNNNAPFIDLDATVHDIYVCANDTFNYTFHSKDYDVNDSVEIFYLGGLKGATFSTTNGLAKHACGTITWLPDSSDFGVTNTLVLGIKDNACPVSKMAIKILNVKVKPDTILAQVTTVDSGCANYLFKVTYPQNLKNKVFVWSGNELKDYTTDSFLHHFREKGNYPVSFQLFCNEGCSPKWIDTIKATKSLVLELPPDSTVCYGKDIDIDLKVKGKEGQLNTIWSTGDTSSSNILIKEIIENKIITVMSVDSLGCKASAQMKINVLPRAYIDYIPDLCEYEPAFFLSQFEYPKGGTWTSESPGFTTPYFFNPTKAGVGMHWVYYAYNYPSFGCFSKDSAMFVVNSIPEIDFMVLPPICDNSDKIDLNAYVVQKGGSWIGITKNSVEGSQFVPSVANKGYHKAIYDYYDTWTGCNNKDTLIVNVLPGPFVFAGTQSGDTLFCNTSSKVKLSGTPIGGTWLGPSGAIISNSHFNPNICKDSFEKFTIRYRISDSSGCLVKENLDLYVKFQPYVVFDSISSENCLDGFTYFYSHPKFTNQVNYSSNAINGGKIFNDTIRLKYLFSSSDYINGKAIIYATAIDTGGICPDFNDSFDFNVFDHIPKGDFYFEQLDTSSLLFVRFYDSVKVYSGSIDSFIWNFGDGNYSVQRSPVHQYDLIGKYNVSLNVKSDFGCSLYDTKTVNVTNVSDNSINPPQIEIFPNPANDYLIIKNLNANYSLNLVQIFDIYGKLVYEEQIDHANYIYIDLPSFNKGQYFIRVFTDKQLNVNRKVTFLSF